MKSHGLLGDDHELRADLPFRGERVLEGLVIDDYYAISIEEEPLQPGLPSLPVASSQAGQAFRFHRRVAVLDVPDLPEPAKKRCSATTKT